MPGWDHSFCLVRKQWGHSLSVKVTVGSQLASSELQWGHNFPVRSTVGSQLAYYRYNGVTDCLARDTVGSQLACQCYSGVTACVLGYSGVIACSGVTCFLSGLHWGHSLPFRVTVGSQLAFKGYSGVTAFLVGLQWGHSLSVDYSGVTVCISGLQWDHSLLLRVKMGSQLAC